jgi:radical SAM protein with 4Fe4S-binding SPASM domain
MSLAFYFKKVSLNWNRKVVDLLYQQGMVMPPKLVAWDSTRRCNLNCQHCGAKKENYPRELMTDEIEKLIGEIAEWGVQYFGVTGGEPLMRQDLLDIFAYAKRKGLSTSLATNGFFIDELKAKEIARLFDSVQISLDGPEATHNQIRENQLAFAKAIGAMRLLKLTGVRQLTISSVITPTNLPQFDELAEIVKQIEPNIWKIVLVMPIGRAEENQNLVLDKEQFMSLVEKIIKLRKQWKKKTKIDLGENSAYLGECDSHVRETPFFCPVGFNACCVGVDGNIRGCPEQPDIEYFREGNILEKSLKEIWTNGFKKYRTKEFLQDKNCANCAYKKHCRGGCWVCRNQEQTCPAKMYNL